MKVVVRVTFSAPDDPARTDTYGNPVRADPETIDIPGCVFDPGSAPDHDLTGVAVTGAPLRARVFCPVTAHRFDTEQSVSMTSADPLIDTYLKDRRGDRLVFEVDGEPNLWQSPFTGTACGVEVPLAGPKPRVL